MHGCRVELMFSLKGAEELIWTCPEDFSLYTLYYYLLELVMMYRASKIKTVDRSNTFRSVYFTPCILYLVRKLEYTCFNGTFKVSTVQFKVSKKHKGYFNAWYCLRQHRTSYDWLWKLHWLRNIHIRHLFLPVIKIELLTSDSLYWWSICIRSSDKLFEKWAFFRTMPKKIATMFFWVHRTLFW